MVFNPFNSKYLLSSEHDFNENMNRFSDSVKSITGKYPAVQGTDFIWNGIKDNGQAIVFTCKVHSGLPHKNDKHFKDEIVDKALTDFITNKISNN